MSLPPLHDPFPPGYWQVRWVAGIHRKNEKSRTASTLVLTIAPIRNYQLGATANQLWCNSAVNLAEQIEFKVPLTYLAATPVGTIGIGRDLIAPRHNPDLHETEVGTFDIEVDIPESQRFIRIDEYNPRGDRYVIGRAIHDFKGQFRRLKNTSCIAIDDKAGNRQIIIPVFELIRFYWGTSSSAFAYRLIDSPIIKFVKKEDFNAFVDPKYTGLDEQGVFHCALRPGLSDDDAYAIGRLWLDPVARQNVNNLLSGLRLPQNGFGGLATKTGFPFTGSTSLRVEGINTTDRHGKPVLLVYRIRRCTHDLPFKGIHIFKPRISLEDQSHTALSGSRHSEVSSPTEEMGRGVKLHPVSTSPDAPRNSSPVMYEGESLKDLFPDLTSKTLVYSKVGGGGSIITHPRSGEEAQPGGHGPGVTDGIAIPVGTEPEGDRDESPPRFVDELARVKNPPLEHLETLDKAVVLLRQQGFNVIARCCDHPDEWFTLKPVGGAQTPRKGKGVYDTVLKTQRFRRGKLFQISKFDWDSNVSEPKSHYIYIIDLELEGSAFACFEYLDKRHVSEDILNKVISICEENGGVWRREHHIIKDGKKRRLYRSNLTVPHVKSHITEHRWKDDENKLVEHIIKLYNEVWDGLETVPVANKR